MKNWLDIPNEDKSQLYNEIAMTTGMAPYAVEKDWWVTHTLAMIFRTSLAPHLVFKGGTSLSKAWGLIERFSEDIDIALDRKFFGFNGPMSGTQVRKLRRMSFEYISKEFYPELAKEFEKEGIAIDLRIGETKDPDQDPLTIELYYPSVIAHPAYIQPRVLIEIGSRSLREPFSQRQFSSLVGSHFPGQAFSDNAIEIPTVNPERTLLEKIFLLHEEFQKAPDKIRVDRLSRHLYDIEKLMQTEHANNVLKDETLYKEIVHHRRTVTALRGIDYDRYKPEFINPLPPKDVFDAWKEDYRIMQEQMIYGESVSFEELLERIESFKTSINQLTWKLA